MDSKEIKKAWNRFKNQNKQYNGCCYMNARQIENHTATIRLTYMYDYDEAIKSFTEYIDELSDKEGKYVADAIERSKKALKGYQDLKAKYGSKKNEIDCRIEELINSESWNELQSKIGMIKTSIEFKDDYCYLRLNY